MRFETEQDLENERRIVERFCKKFSITAAKMPLNHGADYCLSDEKKRVRAFAEVKKRNYRIADFETAVIDAAKWADLMTFYHFFLTAPGSRMPILILSEWLDGFYYFKYAEQDGIYFSQGGRTKKTRNENDFKPVVEIPTKYFKEF